MSKQKVKIHSNSIFSEVFLSEYISDFRLSNISGIRNKSLILDSLIEELKTGKIEKLKEEEFKSRFIINFFGDVLGFNSDNPNNWLLREEKKSTIDGTKPDAVLGYCLIDKTNDDVRALIEIKDANTDLDVKQESRSNPQTPVDQAFSYVSKMGGNCKWVIVSNIKEIRFYSSLDRAKYQVFFLKDLADESKFKELLFLFHKDRFIKKDSKSSTDLLHEKAKTIGPKDDKSFHIIDKLFSSLQRFKDFGFVDPHYLSSITPFNILDDYVWHYSDRNLFTINTEIYSLLREININDSEVIFSDTLNKEILAYKVIEAKYKVEWVFSFLNGCLINKITAIKDYRKKIDSENRTIGFSIRNKFSFKEGEEGITKDITGTSSGICDCIKCNYKNFEFDKFLRKLKNGTNNDKYDTIEYAYGHYLASSNGFKTTYHIYKSIEKSIKSKEGKGVEYFLLKYNIKHLQNLISTNNDVQDSKELIDDIKFIDLDKVIHDEIEFDIDKEVKEYLIKVKEDVLIYKLQDKIEELTFKIEELKQLYDKGGKLIFGSSHIDELSENYLLLYLHINSNNIIYDIFSRYKNLTKKVFKGLITSYQTHDFGIKKFNIFFLKQSILHINTSDLTDILKSVDTIEIIEGHLESMLILFNNFLSSCYKDGFFNEPNENSLLNEQLNNYHFKDVFEKIFSNFLIILSRLEITKEEFSSSNKLLFKMLKIVHKLNWHMSPELSKFIKRKGYLFEEEQLVEILQISINNYNYGYSTYTDLMEQVPKTLSEHYPNYRITSTRLIKTALLHSMSENILYANFRDLVYLLNICDSACRKLLCDAFEEYLDAEFKEYFYYQLLLYSNYRYDSKNYFQLYTEYIDKHKLPDNFLFIGYACLIYSHNIPFNKPELKLFVNLSEFERWLLNPIDFNYENFNAKWLLTIYDTIIINSIKGNREIANSIEKQLETEFDPILAEIKYKYFLPNHCI
jgi:hypothetical protein